MVFIIISVIFDSSHGSHQINYLQLVFILFFLFFYFGLHSGSHDSNAGASSCRSRGTEQTSNLQLRLLERKANPLRLPRSQVLCPWSVISCRRYTVSLAYCAIIVKMHTSNRFHPVYGCVLILVSVMYFNVEAKCPAGLKNKTCRRDLSRICPACIEVSWLIRPPFTFQNGNYTSGILPGTKVQIFYKHLTL